MPTDNAQPAHVSLLLAFANTVDVEDGTDDLGSAADLAGWLAGRGLVPSGARATDADLAAAVRLRDALRARFRAHHDNTADNTADAAADTELTAAAAPFPLRLAVHDGTPTVVPAGEGVSGGLGAVVAAVVAAHADGMLPRLKICAEDTCAVAFVDASKNRSRQWCSMKVCGNRAKTRSYRARQRNPA